MRHMGVMAFAAAFAVSAAAGAADTADELGGNIVVWPKDHGKFLFVNYQKKLAGPVLERPVDWLRKFTVSSPIAEPSGALYI